MSNVSKKITKHSMAKHIKRCSNKARKSNSRHSKNKNECPFCKKTFDDKGILYTHIRSVHFVILREQDKLNSELNIWFQGFRTFECFRCKYSSNYSKIKLHMRKCNIKSKLECCPYCVMKFESIPKMSMHVTKVHS